MAKTKTPTAPATARREEIVKTLRKIGATNVASAVPLSKIYEKVTDHVPAKIRQAVRSLVKEGFAKKSEKAEGIVVSLTAKTYPPAAPSTNGKTKEKKAKSAPETAPEPVAV